MLNKIKYYRIPIMFIIAILVFIGIVIFFIVHTGPKTPLTCEQFDQIANELGYETTDTTDKYTDFDETFIASRKIISDDFRFEYFEFNDSSSATSLYSGTYTEIIGKRSLHDIEYSDYYNNYRHYALESNGKYYTVIYVENTTVVAECDATYKGKVLDILTEMDYRPDKKK